MPKPDADKELDQILEQIFQGADSLPTDEALKRALEIDRTQGNEATLEGQAQTDSFDPVSLLISTIGRIMLRLDRIELVLNRVEQHLAAGPHQVPPPPQVPPGDND